MANPVAGIDIVARLDQFKRDMAQIPNIGEKQARLMAAQMSKEIKAAERASNNAAKAARANAAAHKDFGDKAGAAGQSASKLAGAIGLISPEAGEAARTVADLADVGEVAGVASTALGVSLGTLGVALGVVTAAAGLGYLAWREYHREEEAAKRKTEALAGALKQLQPIHDLAESAALDLAHATGKVSDAEFAYQKGLEGARSSKAQSIDAAKKQVAVNRELLAEMGKTARTLDGVLVPRAQEYQTLIDEGNAILSAAERAYGDVERSLLAVRDATVAAESAEARAKRETLERTAAQDAFTAAVRENIDAENEAYALDKERAKLAAANAKIIDDAAEKSAERRLEAEETLRVRLIEMDQEQTEQYRQGLEDRKDLAVQYVDEATNAITPYLEALDAVTSAQLEAHTSALMETQDQIAELDTLIAALGDTGVDAAELSGAALLDAYKAGEVAVDELSDRQRAALERQLTEEREAAEAKAVIEREAADAAFATQKGVSIANAAVAGLVGAVSAFQLGPIAGAIAAVGIAALTATNIALIASTKPSYQHAGGVSGEGYPDEVDMRRLPGEGVINRQGVAAMGGPAAVNAINGGHVPGGVTVLRIGRHEAREVARTDIRSNGIIPQTIRALSRRSSRGAGRSGRGAIA